MTIEAQDPDGTLHVSKLADCAAQPSGVVDIRQFDDVAEPPALRK